MPGNAFDWMTRVKSVEREYAITRLAIDRFQQQVMENPALLTGTRRFRDIRTTADHLEGTYVVRLFSEFESALKAFVKAEKIRIPAKAELLVNKVRDRNDIPAADANNVHFVREYRNALVHDRKQPAPPVSVRDSTRFLTTFLSWLQRTW